VEPLGDIRSTLQARKKRLHLQDYLLGECAHAMSLVYTQYDKIDIYNVYAPKCNTDESALSSSSKNTVEKTAKVIAHFSNFCWYFRNIAIE